MSDRLRDPPGKRALREAYRTAVGIAAVAASVLPRPPAVHVFYGGARPGDRGGALVKVKRLAERFPEDRSRFSVLYSLSNTPYLPAWALRVMKARGVAIAHNQNGVFYPAWFAGDWRAQNARMAEAYHLADHVFWQSKFCRRAADKFLGDRRGPGEVLYNAIDVERFSPAPSERRNAFTALVAGKLDAHVAYRLTDAIRGLALARRQGLDARLAVAGSVAPEAEGEARELAALLGVEARFLGPYTQEAAPGIYCSADVYLMTKHNDPCPNTVLEAMACGLPVIYSASGGVPELVGDAAGVGLPVEQGFDRVATPEPQAIADGILRVAAEREAMGAAARRRSVERFDIRAWLARHEQVFNELVTQ